MEPPTTVSEQIAFNRRPKNQEHMLIAKDKSTQEDNFFSTRRN